MAFTKYQIFLALLQITTGSINTLSTKWADTVESEDTEKVRKFQHPFVQACAMFFGEFLCLVVFKAVYHSLRRRHDGSEDISNLTKGNREFNPIKLYIPAVCDMVATSLMYIGLNMTYASSFQMFRGAVIIFVALLSIAFLQRRLVIREWTGIFIIVIGLALVGVSDMLTSSDSSEHTQNEIITGDLLIFAAQIITAIQMVYEEKFVAGVDIPSLQAVGYEGVFGFGTLAVLLIPFYYIKVGHPFSDNSTCSLENVLDALYQIKNSWQIALSISGTIVSIAFFNYAGISVTKEISATTRMVLDSVRTVVIWAVTMGLGWQSFHGLQMGGFIFLLFGMCLYNDVVICQVYRYIRDLFIRRSYGNVVNETNVIVNRPADDTPNA